MKKLSFIVAVMLIAVTIGCAVPGVAFAANDIDITNYTNVLDDLQQDENFDVKDYPAEPGNHKSTIFQIAESVDNELFLYVYMPGRDMRFVAKSIKMSLTGDLDALENYELVLLNSYGTLFKYMVKGVTVSRDTLRLYYIVSISRDWVAGVDDDVEGNAVSLVADAVGLCWKAVTMQDTVIYDCDPIEYLDITKQFVDCIRYSDGFLWSGTKTCDAHYFVFNCTNQIDYLKSARIKFKTQEYKKMEGQSMKFKGKATSHDIVIDSTMEGHSRKETWQRLTSVTEFLREHKVTDEERNRIKGYSWMMNFYETEFQRDAGGKDILITLLVPGGFIWSIVNACTTRGYLVTDVELMRLEFSYNGDIYNLGAVSNVQSSTIDHSGDGWNSFVKKAKDFFDRIGDWFVKYWWVIVIVAVVIFIGIFGWIFKPFGKALLVGLRWIGIGIWYAISAPARGIVLLAEKAKENKQ